MKDLKYYQQLNYKMEIEFNTAERSYFVTFPELPGCMADGEDPNKAVEDALKAKNNWLEVASKAGWKIPEPSPKDDPSGRLTARLPRFLHKKLITRAQREGISQNQLIIAYIAEGLEGANIVDALNKIEGRLFHKLNNMETCSRSSALSGICDATSDGSDYAHTLEINGAYSKMTQ
ncbi:MAG: type II toxin-antitoxin system HicB family antitoxin [Syntrophorhabdaceae bacterium]